MTHSSSPLTTTAHPGFLHLEDVFKLATASPRDFSELSPRWFPEIAGVIHDCQARYKRKNQRLAARTAHYQSFDSSRYSEVVTLWLDDKPFAIVMAGGRSGRDKKRRIVTDVNLFREAVGHVLGFLELARENGEDVLPLDYEIPAECIFDFYTGGVAEQVGFPVAQRRRDLYEFCGSDDVAELAPVLGTDEILIAALGVPATPLLRSGDKYFAHVRDITPQDIEASPVIPKVVDALARKSGSGTGHIYKRCNVRPTNYREAVPI